MAAHTVARSKHFTLTGADTVDSVTITGGCAAVEVVHLGASGAAPVYFTVTHGGALNPTVGGDDTYIVLAGETLTVPVYNQGPTRQQLVELVAAAAVAVAVTGTQG